MDLVFKAVTDSSIFQLDESVTFLIYKGCLKIPIYNLKPKGFISVNGSSILDVVSLNRSAVDQIQNLIDDVFIRTVSEHDTTALETLRKIMED